MNYVARSNEYAIRSRDCQTSCYTTDEQLVGGRLYVQSSDLKYFLIFYSSLSFTQYKRTYSTAAAEPASAWTSGVAWRRVQLSTTSQLWYLELVSSQLSTPLFEVRSSLDGSSVRGSISRSLPFGRTVPFSLEQRRSRLLNTATKKEVSVR